MQKDSVAKKKSGGKSAQSVGGQNCKVKGTKVPGHSSASELEEQPKADGSCTGDVQLQILQELKRVNKRLDAVEERVEADGSGKQQNRKDFTKLSRKQDSYFKSKCKAVYSSDSSDEDSDFPTLSQMRMSNVVQKKIDEKISSLARTQNLQGNDQGQKIKSKRGGAVDVLVSHKVAWPHEQILGGSTKQRISYDQLSLTQFVQGFIKNVLEEENQNYKDSMLQYLADLMEDATDFSWASAKASHAVLLCEMERGALKWSDTPRIDRIRRAHAQKHTSHRTNWVKNQDVKKPWFCKAFQTNACRFQKDHEVNGKIHRHICSYCLSQGRIMNHSEKECAFSRKVSKNEQVAAQL